MLTQIITVGTLHGYTFELKGDKNFPVGKLDVSTGQDRQQFDVTGSMAEYVNALVGEADGEPQLKIVGRLAARTSESGDVYTNLEAVSVGPDNSASLGTVFNMTGIIDHPITKPGRNGEFKVPVINLISADRNGVIPIVPVQLQFNRRDEELQSAAMTNGYGQLAEISGTVTSFMSDKGRAYPKFQIGNISTSDLPEYLSAFGPQDAAGAQADLI